MDHGIKPGMMKYCVVGNVIMERQSQNGVILYGTATYPGGRKVYISRRLWGDEVTVLGLNRFKSRYVLERVPLAWIENIRFSKTFKTRVIEHMINWDCNPNMWWLYKDEDKIGAMEYAQLLNRVKAGDQQAFEQYYNDVMWQFL